MNQEIEEVFELMNDGGSDDDEETRIPLNEEEILSVITAEMSQAATGNFTAEVDGNRQDALDYYLGNPRGDEMDGRSQIISTDVADAIEWIMPQIIKSLTAKGPVIDFDAVSEDDEVQAQMETEFTHDIFMKENEGFLNLHEFTKDALMQKNGMFKIYYDTEEEITTERYDGLNWQELEALAQQPNTEIVDMKEEPDVQAQQQQQQQQQLMQQQIQQIQQQMRQVQDPAQQQHMQKQAHMLHQHWRKIQQQPSPVLISVEVEVTKSRGRVRVDCISPEEFRVNQNHDSLNLDEARFTAHVRLRTKSDLIEAGYDREVIEKATDNLSNTYDREYRFAMQDESVYSNPNYSEDDSQLLLEVAECYMKIDIEKTGVSKLMQITTLGVSDPTHILDIQPCEENPFVSSTAIIMSHKFFGLSIYDRLKQLQDMKTSLWRNIMDNLYLQNNREKEVVESQVNLDDLMVSRPGGIKRVKQPGMIRELEVQPIGQEGYQMLDYMDQVRTGRVGVSPDTAGNVDALGSAVGSEGVAQILSAKEELTGLMVRVIAETGLKPAYKKIRDMLIRYQDSETAFKFRGEWQNVNPSQWGRRSRTTIKVGTGTGDDQRKVGAIQQVIAYQAQAIADPRNTLVFPTQLFESLDEFCRVSGLTGAAPYFLDPSGQEGKQKQQEIDKTQQQEQQKQDALNQQMAQAQQKLGEAEMMKGQAALESQKAKIQTEQGKLHMQGIKQQSENEKASLQLQLDQLKTQLDTMKDSQKLSFDYAKLEQDEALKLTELEMAHQQDLSAQNEANKQEKGDAKTK